LDEGATVRIAAEGSIRRLKESRRSCAASGSLAQPRKSVSAVPVGDAQRSFDRVGDPLRGGRVLEVAGVADQRPPRARRGAEEAAHQGLRRDQEVARHLGPLEDLRRDRRGELPQPPQVPLQALLPGAAGELGGPRDGQQVQAVLDRPAVEDRVGPDLGGRAAVVRDAAPAGPG